MRCAPLKRGGANCVPTTNPAPRISEVQNTVGHGDAEVLLKRLPDQSIDLVFTSPPYYNARPEYAEYPTYENYLATMRKIVNECARVLFEGRFFVLNVSPVLIPRNKLCKNSKRLAIPFDFHAILVQAGFDFIDDIIWVKPDASACNRGKNFYEYRNPLGYKTNPITEYVLVYRKHSDRPVTWLIQNHPDREAMLASKVNSDYEQTNIWKIAPAHNKKHPAVFPSALAEKVITYYSFKNDVVLDLFGGTGTTAKAAHDLERRFVTFEREPKYIELIKNRLKNVGYESIIQ